MISCATAPEFAAYRAHIAERGDRFDRSGFPVPPRPSAGRPAAFSALPGLVIAAGTLVVVILLALLAGEGESGEMWAVVQGNVSACGEG